MSRLLRTAAALVLTLGLTAAVAAPATAEPAQPLIGPECAPNVVAAVLVAVAGRVAPGQVIQYLQITSDGVLQLCTVTVPGGAA